MVEQHLPLRATGLARALGVLVLLAGIVAMHAAVFAVHGEAAAADHHAMAGGDPIGGIGQMRATAEANREYARMNGTPASAFSRTMSDDITPDPMSVEHGIAGKDGRGLLAMSMAVTGSAVLSDANHVVPKPDCAGDGCGGTHGGMHGCVFILAAAALLLALVLLYRLGVARPGNAVARLRHRRPRRERSPPWTVLSLAELSILRI
ncbi:hypothetical protein F3087_13165 [Nocardia colli]|uniref:Uncharacterized protein n=1 Tax=Nocardia colli TaxID=2545717 RepID=A0A5N0EID2_9NOCA|nr:DUF6153 family protein [Nocardia colli]KAA8888024.1 hypothetical protein F3087_13165 [Nocardia colli]